VNGGPAKPERRLGLLLASSMHSSRLTNEVAR
jgi:hypothetical protein